MALDGHQRLERQDRFGIAVLALGGQGGGVLADWIAHVARENGWLAQATSVPGVAQRTGSTVYYIEIARQTSDASPIMAQMPVPGDVDIVIASELMETGRAVLRGFSTVEKTTLIGSTHRIYAISEKSQMGDGRGSSEKIIKAAGERSKHFIGFDMEAATVTSGSVISSIMFGALAGSNALPFSRSAFEQAIAASGIAVDANMRGFDVGFSAAKNGFAQSETPEDAGPVPSTESGRKLAARVHAEVPAQAQRNALHGAARLTDYQDVDYANFYLDRLGSVAALDRAPYELTSETARYLALWMSYEDTIRVADLKVRDTRFARVREEVLADPNQIVGVTEFMHPRLQEICETLPRSLGSYILGNASLSKFLNRFFQSGRHVNTTSIRWFLMLRLVSKMRRFRSNSLRFHDEQSRIEAWLSTIREAASEKPDVALELALCQRLIKGYGDTFERGLLNFETVMSAYRDAAGAEGVAEMISKLRRKALSNDEGAALPNRPW